MKKLLLHTFAILLSTLMMVETIGVYLTKDVCTPCGESVIKAQLINDEIEIDETAHHLCEDISHEQEGCEHETHCSHNDAHHEHRQEHYFYKNISVFLSAHKAPELEAQTLTLIAPLVAILLNIKSTKGAINVNF